METNTPTTLRRHLPALGILLAIPVCFFVYAQVRDHGKQEQRPAVSSVTVVRVTDGDTIVVSIDGVEKKIRLNGIDCPEFSQPHGEEAKKFVEAICLNRYPWYVPTVWVVEKEQDRYGRTIADVEVRKTFGGEKLDLGRELVSHGLAWWYREYSNDSELERLEQEAREKKVGLWADENPTPPWEFRHGGATYVDDEQSTEGRTVFVTRTGQKYHRAGCRYLAKSRIPMKLDQAGARYSPCSVCKP